MWEMARNDRRAVEGREGGLDSTIGVGTERSLNARSRALSSLCEDKVDCMGEDAASSCEIEVVSVESWLPFDVLFPDDLFPDV